MTKKQYILEYLRKIRSSNKELTKKEAFKDLLNRLYQNNAEIVRIIDKMTLGAEKTIFNIPRKDRIHFGVADTIYNNIIIEFENNLTKNLKHAKEQLSAYFLGELRSGKDYNFTLIASDFINWKIFAPDISLFEGDKIYTVKVEDVILNEVKTASFTLTEENAEEFFYWIDRFLFKETPQRATLESVKQAFGLQSWVFIESFRILTNHYKEIKKFGQIQVSYNQWKRFMSIAYGYFEDKEEIFLIHTYLSIFSKLLAYSVLSNNEYISEGELKQIIDGSIFDRFKIANFVETDFFNWVSFERSFKGLKNVFRLIAQEISNFDYSKVEEDILKGVYQELIDVDTRQALGEYYTPDWLCKKIVEKYTFTEKDKILDPSCGSGSFLRAAIHKIKNDLPHITVEQINNMIFGIDIHPLSVQITKTTILLAFGNDLLKVKKPIFLNIILANTLLAPEGIKDLFGKNFRVKIDNKEIELNTQILDNITLFNEALEVCDEIAEQTKFKKEIEKPLFEKILKRNITKNGLNDVIINNFYKIYLALKNVKEKNRDSIWKFILQNTYKPYFLNKKFTYVIGNPPWFTFSSVKNPEYQEILNNLADDYNVKPEKTANLPHLEIATIFFAHSVNYFLKENGKLAFVLPRSIITADQHHNFRSLKIPGFKIKEIWDLEKVSPLFNIPSIVIFADKTNGNDKKEKSEITGYSISGKLPIHNSDWDLAKDYLRFEKVNWYYVQMGNRSSFAKKDLGIKQKINPYLKEFKQGATIVPRTFYFVILDQIIPPDFEERIIVVKTNPSIYKNAKKPWRLKFYQQIESEFLFLTAISQNILPFSLINPQLIVLPIFIDKNKKIKVVNGDQMRAEGFLYAPKWFDNVERLWDLLKKKRAEKMTYLDRLNFHKGLTSQKLNKRYLVLYTASAKNANAVVVDRKNLPAQPPFNTLEFIVESATYVYYTNNKNEALYLTAILNSTPPNKIIKDFQAKGLFGPRHVHKKILEVYFPKYSSKRKTHQKLAELAEICHQKAAEFIEKNPVEEDLNPYELGHLRVQIKKLVKKELEQIDDLVKKIIK